MHKNPRVLLVMQNMPLDSPFLAEKFTRLLKEMDIHLLVWDNETRVNTFIEKYDLYDNRNRIHIGITKNSQAITAAINIFLLILTNKRVRNFLLTNWETKKLKTILRYLPVFKINPDIIHFEFGTLANDIKSIKQVSDAKAIVSFRGYDLNYVGLSTTDYYNDIWDNADALHFLGNDLRTRAIKRGYKGNKTEAIISPAIDTTLFAAGTQTTHNEKLIIASVGRLSWKKGYEYALLAMAQLKHKNIPFEYHIVGDGNHRQAIEYTIYENGLEGNVKLHGHKSPAEIKGILSNADVFLHPAVSEGFCNAVIEAQAMGLPVICTDADGLPENIKHNVTGFVVPKWDADAIAQKIEWCVANRDRLQEIGKKGIERVNRKFRIEDQVQSFMALYNKVHEG